MDPVGQVLSMLTGLGVLVRIDPLITVAVVVPLILALAIVNTATRRIQEYRRAQQDAIGDITGLLGEIFGATTAVKVAGAEEHVMAHVRDLNEARRRATLRDLLLTQLLSSISLNATGITDTALEHLRKHTQLKSLVLSGTKITDTGLANLTDFVNLTHLKLSYTQVGDEGLKKLAACKSLRALELKDTKVTFEGVAKLQEVLPDCKIVSSVAWHGWPADAPPPAIAPCTRLASRSPQVSASEIPCAVAGSLW